VWRFTGTCDTIEVFVKLLRAAALNEPPPGLVPPQARTSASRGGRR
jgi:hypothetical protein